MKEVRGERECGEVRDDEVIDEGVQSLKTVEQSQFLQVQVVVLTHLLLQVLAAEIHHSPNLNEQISIDHW